jgi:hypothetical protein
MAHDDDPARLEVLNVLRHLAVEVYGEERAAETPLKSALEAAAAAVWRVSQEGLEVSGDEP